MTEGKVTLPTPERISEIRELLAAATPGPWEVVNYGNIEIATGYKCENGIHVANWIAEMDVQEEDEEEQAGADAELIVAAVNSLPGLLDALEEAQQRANKLERTLEAERVRGTKWEKAFDNADRQYLKMEKQAADLRRQIAGKTEELAEAQQTIARQREALEWYASDLPYKQEIGWHDDERKDTYWEAPEISKDRGARARAVLENKEGDSES